MIDQLTTIIRNNTRRNASPSVVFDVNGDDIGIASPDTKIIECLSSFFFPYISEAVADKRPVDRFKLATTIDDPLYQSTLRALAEYEGEDIAVNLTHRSSYHIRIYRPNSGALRIAVDEALGVLFCVLDQERLGLAIGAQNSRMRTALLRLLRALWVRGQNAPTLHGCAVQKNRRGLVVMGEKYAGKTTSLLGLCSMRGYNIVANDRFICRPDGGVAFAVGVPTVVNIRENTIKPFPALRPLHEAKLYAAADLSKALGVGLKAQTPISAALFLTYDGSCDALSHRRLEPSEIDAKISPHVLSADEHIWAQKLLGRGGDPSETVGGVALLERVPCYDVRCNELHIEDRVALFDALCQGISVPAM